MHINNKKKPVLKGYILWLRDKMEVQVDTLCLLAQAKEGQQQFKNKKQPELTENRTAWKSDDQGDTEETFIRTGRRGGDGQPGWRGLSARRWLTDPERWWIVEQGRQCSSQQTPQPHIPHRYTRRNSRGVKQTMQPRAPARGNKASNL